MLNKVAEIGHIMMQLQRDYAERAYRECLTRINHFAGVVGKLFLVVNILVAIDLHSELGIFGSILCVVTYPWAWLNTTPTTSFNL